MIYLTVGDVDISAQIPDEFRASSADQLLARSSGRGYDLNAEKFMNYPLFYRQTKKRTVHDRITAYHTVAQLQWHKSQRLLA